MTDGTDRLGFLLHDATRLLRKRFEQRGTRFGLSSAQWRLLARLVKEEGVAQARLAELLEIEPISVSRLLDRMEQAGWIERQADPKDRRVRMVFPTPRAREAYGEVKGMAGEVYAEALAGLSDEEKRVLIRGLDAIATNLGEGDAATTERLARTA